MFSTHQEFGRTIKPGGWVWLSEFENPDDPDSPVRVPLEGHDEYSIAFGTLEHVAKRIGFEVEITSLIDEIGINMDSPYVAHPIGDADGIYLSDKEACKYYPDQYSETTKFEKLSTEEWLTFFKVLKLRKPLSSEKT